MSGLLRNTEILTMNDGVKLIQDIKIGDRVATHKGNVDSVIKVYQDNVEYKSIHVLHILGGLKIKVFGDQFICSNDNKWIQVNQLIPGYHYVRSLKAGYVGILSNNIIEESITDYVYKLGIENEDSYPIGSIGIYTKIN